MPWISTATSSITPTVSAQRPRRQATAAIAATVATLVIPAVLPRARASPTASLNSGAPSQNSSGPGWAHPFTV